MAFCPIIFYKHFSPLYGDEVVLSKIVLLNFRPKQPNELIGGPRASVFEIFIAILT
jgi:hypothetical protein